VRDGPQQRPGAVRGRAELAFQDVVAGQLHRGAVDGGDLQALPQGRDPQLRVGAGRVQLEDLPHDLLAQQPAGLGERAAGRDLRAGPQPQSRQPERLRQHRIVTVAGEHQPGPYLRKLKGSGRVTWAAERLRCAAGNSPDIFPEDVVITSNVRYKTRSAWGQLTTERC
jgi:hypothetical protein